MIIAVRCPEKKLVYFNVAILKNVLLLCAGVLLSKLDVSNAFNVYVNQVMFGIKLGWILSAAAIVYVSHAIWSLAGVFMPPKCSPSSICLRSKLATQPLQDLVVFTAPAASRNAQPNKVLEIKPFDYSTPFTRC